MKLCGQNEFVRCHSHVARIYSANAPPAGRPVRPIQALAINGIKSVGIGQLSCGLSLNQNRMCYDSFNMALKPWRNIARGKQSVQRSFHKAFVGISQLDWQNAGRGTGRFICTMRHLRITVRFIIVSVCVSAAGIANGRKHPGGKFSRRGMWWVRGAAVTRQVLPFFECIGLHPASHTLAKQWIPRRGR